MKLETVLPENLSESGSLCRLGSRNREAQRRSLPKHQTLVAGSDVLDVLVKMDAGCNVRTLLLDANQHVTGLIVEAFVRVVVT